MQSSLSRSRARLNSFFRAPGLQLLLITVAVLATKLVIYLIDHTPAFFLGDSCTYVWTALYKHFPPDRSFTYGYLIRILCVRHHLTLRELVAVQMLLGAASSVLLAACLLRFVRTSFAIALVSAILFSIEPLEVLSEHLVMTEACSGFLLALYFFLSLRFVKHPRVWPLLILPLLAFALTSIRLANLPLILIFSLLLPIAAFPQIRNLASPIRPWLRVSLYLALSIATTQLSLFAYRVWDGKVGKRPPAYGYADGFFWAADLAPMIQPIDEPDPSLRARVFGALRYPLADLAARPLHRWYEGGLVENIKKNVPDATALPDFWIANITARNMAMHAIRRDPVGLIYLAAWTFRDYWDPTLLKNSVDETISAGVDPTPACMSAFQAIGYTGNRAQLGTPSKRWVVAAKPWYLILLLSPLLILISFPLVPRADRSIWFLLFSASSLYVVLACTLVEKVTVRYLAPVAWLEILVLGSVAGYIQNRFTVNR